MTTLPTDSEAGLEPPYDEDRTASKSSLLQWGMTLGACVIILGIGLAISKGLSVFVPTAEIRPPETRVESVEAITVTPEAVVARITGTGLVTAQQQVNLIPEVSGRIVDVAEGLRPGRRFAANASLARIDSRDYRYGVDMETSRVRQAELELELERGRQAAARREWELLGDGRPESDASLALRTPHLVTAEHNLASAQSSLARAELALERTSLRAPFNAIVVNETLDIGQVVGAGAPVATLIGTDAFRVEASVPVEKLVAIDVPGFNAEIGSEVLVAHRLGPEVSVQRTGRVIGLSGQLDEATRTARLLIQITNPLDPPEGELPLMAGAYVSIDIAGRTLQNTFRLPRRAVLQGDQVWVVTDEQQLASRTVEVAWRTDDDLVISKGLTAGDQVIVSPLAIPIEGMPVRVQNDPTPTPN